LENFELPISGQSSVLLIGNNGSGKTTVGFALQILQKIARGTNRVGDLVKPKDLARGRADVPMRFEIEVELKGRLYEYAIAFDFPEGLEEARVLEEKLTAGGQPVYTRKGAEVRLAEVDQQRGRITAPGFHSLSNMRASEFGIERRLAALPIIQEQSPQDPLSIFKQGLARMIILRPIPSLISGNSMKKTLEPAPLMLDFGDWFSGLLAYAPAAYGKIDSYLKQVMPDWIDIKNPLTGKDSQRLVVQFSADRGSPLTLESLSVPFEDLSDGEKCFMICAVVLAANDAYGPLLCFWDEPDNYLALSEVGHFVVALRKAFQSGGQFIATSHNPEAIRRFSEENTLFLQRRNHLEPTVVRKLNELQFSGDLIGALIRGDVDL
jgi:ABC-type Mn2+/Zn2+ transport system ATPase subunit